MFNQRTHITSFLITLILSIFSFQLSNANVSYLVENIAANKNREQMEDIIYVMGACGYELQASDLDTSSNSALTRSGDQLSWTDSNGNVVNEKVIANNDIDVNCAPQEGGIDDNKGTVTFSSDSEHPLPFDYEASPFTAGSIKNYYTKYGLTYTYNVPWIAMVEGTTGRIRAKFETGDNSIEAGQIAFVARTAKEQVELPFELVGDNTFTVEIFAGEAGSRLDIYAIVKKDGADICQEFTLGRAMVATLKKKNTHLHIVPVFGATVSKSDIEKKLKEVYAPFGKTFDVEIEDNFGDESDAEFDFLKDGLAVEGTKFMKTETAEMTQLKQLYHDIRGFEWNDWYDGSDNAYLFILPKAETSGVMGDMPRCKLVGYVFSDGNTDIPTTIAHEIGHGVFALEHTFEFSGGGEGETCGMAGKSNLMDYCSPQGTFLAVWQWNLLDNHKDFVIQLFEDYETAALEAAGCKNLFEVIGTNYMEPFLKQIFKEEDPLYKEVSDRMYGNRPQSILCKKIGIWANPYKNQELFNIQQELQEPTTYQERSEINKARVLVTAMLFSVAMYDGYGINMRMEGKSEFIPSENKIYIGGNEDVYTINGSCGTYTKRSESATLSTMMHEIGHLLYEAKYNKGKNEQDKEILSKLREYQIYYGHRYPMVLEAILNDLSPYMKDFNVEDWMSQNIGLNRESIEKIYSYIGQGQSDNKNDIIFYELPFNDAQKYRMIPPRQPSGTSVQQKSWVDRLAKDASGALLKTNYLISTTQWNQISRLMDQNDLFSAVNLMMECINVKFIHQEMENGLQEGYSSVLYMGNFIEYIWYIFPYGKDIESFKKKFNQNPYEIPNMKANEEKFGIDDLSWNELKDVYILLQQKNMSESFDIAIKIDNYIRKQLENPNYRDQKGHMILYDNGNRNDIQNLMLEFVYGGKIPTIENKDCKEYQEWEKIEKEIIDILYTNNKKDIYDIQYHVKKWFGIE